MIDPNVESTFDAVLLLLQDFASKYDVDLMGTILMQERAIPLRNKGGLEVVTYHFSYPREDGKKFTKKDLEE